MKTRLFLRGLRRSLAGMAAILLLCGTATAQNESTWTGGGGNGNWNNPANWDVSPASFTDDRVVYLSGSTQTVTNQNIANPLALVQLEGADGSSIFTINGSPITMVASSDPVNWPTQIRHASTTGGLFINVPINFAAPTTRLATAVNATYSGMILSGNLFGNGVTVQHTTVPPGQVVLINARNNTGFSGNWNVEAATITMVNKPNAAWRTWNINFLGPVCGFVTGCTTAVGNGFGDAAWNQQIGSINGASGGQLLVGTTLNASTTLLGFANINMTMNGPGGIAGFNLGSHLGKVGTGTLTFTNVSQSLNMGVSVREGTFVLSGANGCTTNTIDFTETSPYNYYHGGQMRLNNATAPSPTLATLGRLSDIAQVRLSGGVLRIDGNASTAITENVGQMRPFGGQSTVVVNLPSATAANTRFNFASFEPTALDRGGQVAFAGPSLGGTPGAGVSNITFATAPSAINGILPWAISQDNYAVGGHTAANNTFAFNTLAVLGSNGVAPLTTFVDNSLGVATDNVRLDSALAVPGATAANTLTIDTGGGLALGGTLQLTAGAMFARAVTSSISGAGALSSTGRMYINASPTALFDISTAINAPGISKGGAGVVNLLGPINVPAGAVISANAGTLNLGPLAPPNAIYQVARGATMSNIPLGVTGSVRGSGTINGNVTMGPNGLIAASSLAGNISTGAAPGELTINGTLSLEGQSRLRFYITSVFGGRHTQGIINVQGLDLTNASPTNQIVVQPHSIDLRNELTANVYDFDAFENYSWPMIVSSTPIVGFSPDKFQIDLTNFSNPLLGGQFTVITNSHSLRLVFIPIPEPALLGVAALGIFALARRRKA